MGEVTCGPERMRGRWKSLSTQNTNRLTWSLYLPPYSLVVGPGSSWFNQNPGRADLAVKDQMRNDSQAGLCKWFFYFHIYITRCPLTGPNSKVAPFCILRTQKSRYCTFTKAPCFCKSRYDNNHKANESKGMVMSVSSAQTGLLANSTAYTPIAPVGTLCLGDRTLER